LAENDFLVLRGLPCAVVATAEYEEDGHKWQNYREFVLIHGLSPWGKNG
jgi:hypothetical protein